MNPGTAQIQESDYCAKCGKPSVAKRGVPVLYLAVNASGEVSTERTVVEGRGMCVQHKIAYHQAMTDQQQAQVRRAYEDYVRWCEKCQFKPKTFETWDHDRKAALKGMR